MQDSEVRFAEGFGFRYVASKQPATPDTIFGIASLTKSFTALALLMLESQNKLNLGDPVRRYLPDFRYPGLGQGDGGEVQLWHLASHTSGIPPLPGLSYALLPSQKGDSLESSLRDYPEEVPILETYADLLNFLANQSAPPIVPPGQLMSYQNDTYALLGAVIKEVSGVPYAQFVEESVLTPLGMTRSTFSLEEAEARGNLTTLYAEDPAGRVVASPQWEHAPAHLATGFLKASATDLGRYLSFLLRATSLSISAERVKKLYQPRIWCAPQTAYGLGLMVQPYHGVTLVRHGGGLKGVSSYLGFVPERGFGVAVLTSLEDKPVSRLGLAAINLMLGLELETSLYTLPKVEAPLTEKQKLVGSYRSKEPWGKLEIRLEGDALYARRGEELTEAGWLHLAPNGEFLLGAGLDYSGGRWLLDDVGKVRGVQLGLRFLTRRR